MTGAICEWCSGDVDALDDHNENECYREHQRKVYAKGAAAAKAALHQARHTTTEETP